MRLFQLLFNLQCEIKFFLALQTRDTQILDDDMLKALRLNTGCMNESLVLRYGSSPDIMG